MYKHTKLLIIIFAIFLSSSLFSQENSRKETPLTDSAIDSKIKYSIYVGLQPGFFIEPWFGENEYNLNLLPLVIEPALSDHLGVRFRTSLFYRIGNPDTGFTLDVTGGSLGLFYYFNERTDSLQYNGFFIGPFIAYSNWILETLTSVTVAAEAGYSFPIKPRLTLNLSSQFGVSHFFEKDETGQHFGIFVNIGYWI